MSRPGTDATTLRCPRTRTPLRRLKFAGVTVDYSDACGGVWFDRFELDRFDESHEPAGEVLASTMLEAHDLTVDRAPRLNCPVHTDVVMMRRYYSAADRIEIDECPQCGGVWLDADELVGLRDNFTDQARRRSARRALVESAIEHVARHPEVSADQRDHEQLVGTLERVARQLRALLG